jgi:hypothetical protein
MKRKELYNLRTTFEVLQVINSDISHHLVSNYQRTLNRITLNEGKAKACAVLKAYYLIATKVAMGQSFKPVPYRKSDSTGFPKDISAFKYYLLSSKDEYKQIALTVLKSYVAIHLIPDTDIKSITEPCPDISRINWLNSWSVSSNGFINHLKKRTSPHQPWTKSTGIRSTTKKGPNGPALPSSHLDAIGLKSCQPLWQAFKDYNLVMDQVALTDYVQKLYDSKDDLPESFNHSKLSFLSEGGGKTRVVAIGDYWSQESLKGLHNLLHGILKRIKTDGTYDQGRVACITREATKKGLPIFCFDLKSATDRFPVKLIEILLSKIIGPIASDAWTRLISTREFPFKGKKVTYSAGTPMGLLTSWASFALCHHSLIRYAGQRAGFRQFEDYVLLGDDVAIFSEKVAYQYEILLNDLGVSISKDKSMISYGLPHSGAEIAKKVILQR